MFHSAEGYLAIIKDFYEAYVIYQFLSFCIAVLGKGDRNTVVDLLARRADHLTPPFRIWDVFSICGCCQREAYESNRQLADEILLQCQIFAMQFVFFRPVTTTAMVVLDKLEYYGAGTGPSDYRSPQFYIVIIQNISIFVAFTGLLKFYHAVYKDLEWCRPFAKFLCIKGVVFMTFWQGLAISILAQTTNFGGDQADEWATSAQNFLICLEMLLFSIAHFYCFPTEEWEEGYRVKHSQGKFGDSIALSDFFDDVKLILKANVNHKKHKKKQEFKQPTIPEGTDEDSTDAASDATSFNEHDAERAIAEALEDSLGSINDDPDIMEAKKRLLESNVLSPDYFDCREETDAADEDKEPEAKERVRKRLLDDSGEENWEEVGDETAAPKNGGVDHDEEVPTERTGLLSSPNDGGSSFMESLRPSIFTTVASIAEIERRAAAQGNNDVEDEDKKHSD